MKELSEKLLSVIDTAEPKLRSISASDSAKPILPGGWSRKQVLGHLIDSACNNHQRFVRALLQEELRWPGYDQTGCVKVQHFQDASWSNLTELWTSFNSLLAHVLKHVPDHKRKTQCFIGNGAS